MRIRRVAVTLTSLFILAAVSTDLFASSQPYIFGHGINFGVGNKYLEANDLNIAGPVTPLVFSRTYNSQSKEAGILGYGWASSLTEHLVIQTDKLVLVQPGGRHVHFNYNSTYGVWANESGKVRNISGGASGYSLLEPDGSRHNFDAQGRLIELRDKNNNSIIFTYNGTQLASVNDITFGRSYTLAYDPTSGRLLTLTTPIGNFTYEYDTNGNLQYVHKPDAETIQYIYDDPNDVHNLTGIIDETGTRAQSVIYDTSDRVVTSALGGGKEQVTIEYLVNLQRKVTTINGIVTTYQLEVKNGILRVASFTGPGCSSCGSDTGTDYIYNDRQLITQETDARNNVTSYTYDAWGNRNGKTEGVGTAEERTTGYVFTPGTNRLETISKGSVANPGQQAVTTMIYDDQGNLQTKTETGYDTNGPLSRTTTYDFDIYGRIESIDGPRTDVQDATTFTYYPNDPAEGYNRANLHTVVNALGHTATYSSYNAFGKPGTITTPGGSVITLTYHPMGQLRTRSQGGLTATYTYYDNGQLHQLSLPDNRTLTYAYTPNGKLYMVTDNLGNSITYTYNDAGQKIKDEVKDPQGVLQRSVAYSYENTGDLDKATQFDNTFEDLNYDAVGNLVALINAKADATTYEYDALNRLTAMVQPGIVSTGYDYDGNDNLTTVTDPRGNATANSYDDFGRKTSQDSPESGLASYEYDAADNLIAMTDAKGQTATYTYDPLNRLIDAAYADGATETYTYDQCSNGTGKLCTVTDASGSTTWSYDSLGRVISKTQQSTALNTTYSLITGYAYNSQGQLSGMTYPTGMVVTYEYTGGLITGVKVNGQYVLSNIAYQPFGPVQSWNWGNGLPHSRQFDLGGKLIGQSVASENRTLTYDPNRNVETITDGNSLTTYGYDALERLTSTDAPAFSLLYQYDGASNRTLEDDGAVPVTSEYALASNRYAQDTFADPTVLPFASFASGAFSYEGPETGLEAAFESYFNAHPPSRTCGMVNATVDPALNNISWTWSACGSSSGTYNQYPGWYVATVDFPYQYDANGNLTWDDRHVYSYDSRNRMRTVDGEFGSHYEYNAMSQRVFKMGNLKTSTYQNSFRPKYYSYDEEGRLLGEYPGSGVIAWSVQTPIAGQYFKYTGPENGLEAAFETYWNATADGSCGILDATVNTFYNQITWEWSECSGTGTAGYSGVSKSLMQPPKEFVYLGDIPVAMFQTGAVSYIHTDHLGTPLKLTNTSNTVVWKAEYLPFGEATANEDPDANGIKVNFNLRFPGQYFDAETGLHYNWNRYYDPSSGRYLSADPIGLEGGMNLYLYTGANPVNYTDPEGLQIALPGTLPAPGVGGGTTTLTPGQYQDMLDDLGSLMGGDYSPWSSDPAMNDQFIQDRDEVKECDVKPPPYDDPNKPRCDEIRKRIEHLERAMRARVDFVNKWYDGIWNSGHMGRMLTLRKERDKLQRRLNKGDCI